ncbi:hypothetical protein J5N97_023295 [Dioscorea zingiberensis]|uniref:Uncharacterized protein n=1 Tax=Dioscorea zingiberensis TaxID=325984 RepID=A0A9D5CCQ7_9LILI|nr:hypothetical protein J5N97_023295 [Dioscorea zingiberensis]
MVVDLRFVSPVRMALVGCALSLWALEGLLCRSAGLRLAALVARTTTDLASYCSPAFSSHMPRLRHCPQTSMTLSGVLRYGGERGRNPKGCGAGGLLRVLGSSSGRRQA